MFRRCCLIAILIVAGMGLGCDQPKSATPSPSPATTAPATAPATQPVAQAPSTQPATQPAVSELMIDGQVYSFPGAKIRVGKSGSHVIARLYSDDPKAALDDDYKGNHYDVQMRLDDIADPQFLYTSAWQFKAPSAEYSDSPYGIFLDGMRYQLQPLDVSARFLGTMAQVHIDLEGQFLLFDDSDKTAAPKAVYVKGSLLAPVEYKD
jgi:hypothetical protein